jgi:hypothetical protein
MAILTKSPNSKLPKSYTIEPDVNDTPKAVRHTAARQASTD